VKDISKKLFLSREIYNMIFEPVCSKYDLSLTEMLLLLHLSDDSIRDTAGDIAGNLNVAKSHISASVHNLQNRGYIEGCTENGDKRKIHLKLCEAALPIVAEGEKIRSEFGKTLWQGFSEEELEQMRSFLRRMTANAKAWFEK